MTDAAKLQLVRWDDPVLTTPAEKFTGGVGEARDLETRLVDAMREHGGLGLSACQVGLPVAAFALKVDPTQCVFNPRVVDVSQDGDFMDEACLSFPGIVAEVWRPKVVRVRFQTSDGVMQSQKYSGMTARAFLHEMEHVRGGVFFDHLGKMKLTLVARKAEKRYGKPYLMGKLWQIVEQSRKNGETKK